MSKLISVSNEVYEMLKRHKNGKSFSEVIKARYSKPAKSPLDILSGWKPGAAFIEGVEGAYRSRSSLKLKKVRF